MVLIILWWVQQCHIYVLTLIMLRLLDSTYVIRLSTTSAQAYTLQWKWNGKRIIHNCWKSSMEGKCMACLPTFAECLDTKSEIACIFSSNRSVNVICYVMSVQPHTYPLPAVLADSWGTKWKIGLEIMVRGGPFRKEDVNTWWKKWNIIITFTFLYPTWWKEKHDLHFHFLYPLLPAAALCLRLPYRSPAMWNNLRSECENENNEYDKVYRNNILFNIWEYCWSDKHIFDGQSAPILAKWMLDLR